MKTLSLLERSYLPRITTHSTWNPYCPIHTTSVRSSAQKGVSSTTAVALCTAEPVARVQRQPALATISSSASQAALRKQRSTDPRPGGCAMPMPLVTRACAPPHAHSTIALHSHDALPARSVLTVRVPRQRRSYCEGDYVELHLLAGRSRPRGAA